MAKVRLIDDDESQLEVRRLILEQAGHTIVDGDDAEAGAGRRQWLHHDRINPG